MSMGKVSKVEARAAATAVAIGLAMAVACWSTASAWASGDINTSACPNEAMSGFATYLPDCRAFEMVTPPYKDGYTVGHRAIAEDGSRILGNSLGVFAGAVGAPEIRTSLGLVYEMVRGASGWQTNPVTPANPQYRDATTFEANSADLSKTLFTMPTAPVGEDDFYVRGPGTSLVHVGPATPPADGPAFEPGPEGTIENSQIGLEGASADLSHIVFHLLNVGWNGDPTHGGFSNLYEYVGTGNSEPAMVAVTGGPGSTELIGDCGATVGGPPELSKFNAVSEDGDTVFFTVAASDEQNGCSSPQPQFSELYARVNGSETISISAPECSSGCAATQVSDSVFAGASRDGTKAFFLSTQKLTEQASEDTTPGDTAYSGAGTGCQGAGGTGCNLYEYDFGKPSGQRLIAVSGGGAAPHVQGVVRISDDGSHVYFVAQGKLTNEANARGEDAQAGQNNLYVFERDAGGSGGRTTFIAAMAPSEELHSSDEQLWGGRGRPAQATPDGVHLVFESHADLTSDDTSKGVWQVFEYDTATQALTRVSVGNGGFNNNGNTDEYDASIVGPSFEAGQDPRPAALALSNDGTYVFFESADDLTAGMGTPQSGTGASIYEYHEGRVSLIYGGNGSRVSFLGTSANGADAFFSTNDQLVSDDTDTQSDFYDARINGGHPPQAPGKCQSEGCLGGLAETPIFGTPTSTTVVGESNLTFQAAVTPAPKPAAKNHPARCARRKKRRHGKCVKPTARKARHSKTRSSHKGAK